ncbi:MAG: DUF3054 domain-containing protein [Halapricum sp.]
MEQVVSLVDRRFDRTRLATLVALGDVLLIALFVSVGEINHGYPPWRFPVRALGTFLPFFVGWAIVAFVGGLYTRDAWEFPLRAISWTTPAWITAVLIAMAIRATPLVHGGVEVSFALVSMVVGLVLLLPWRTVVAILDAR